MEIKAHAKINLTLDVLRKRPDGYHELMSIMRSVSLCDLVELHPAQGISVESSVPLPADNTAGRAAELFRSATGYGARIYIQKAIPSQAGLGGGSADAAAVLSGLNTLYGNPLSPSALSKMGLAVGADVPFCLAGGCALAEGVGERLTPLPDMDMRLLIVKGGGGISTAELFRGLRLPVQHPRTRDAIEAVKAGDITALAPLCENALEPAARQLLPEIAMNCRRLMDAGALSAFMTGSGSCAVGIFQTDAGAESALARFSDLPFACICR